MVKFHLHLVNIRVINCVYQPHERCCGLKPRLAKGLWTTNTPLKWILLKAVVCKLNFTKSVSWPGNSMVGMTLCIFVTPSPCTPSPLHMPEEFPSLSLKSHD